MHAITANKGPVVYGYRELNAPARGLVFVFEFKVADGAPIFSLFRHSLNGARLLGFSGIQLLHQLAVGAHGGWREP